MMQHEGHVRILKSLKLFGMAHAIEELGNQNSPAFNQALPMLRIPAKLNSHSGQREHPDP